MADKHPTKVRVVLISTVDSSLNAGGGNGARIRAPSAPRPGVNIVARLVSVDYGRLRQPIRTPRRMVVFQSDLFPQLRAFGKRRTQRPPWGAPAASSPFVSPIGSQGSRNVRVAAPPLSWVFLRCFGVRKTRCRRTPSTRARHVRVRLAKGHVADGRGWTQTS